jgi:membrane protein DedA with SNARE-associated domain
MKQSRWRSPVAWASIFTLVAFVLKQYLQIEIGEADKLLELILLAGAGAGIFNNPESKDHY